MRGLAEFEGRWRMNRRIAHRRAAGQWGQTGLFEGVAVFAPDEAGLVLDEAGELRLPPGPALQASRRYLWRAQPDVFEVLFEDGRPFHRIGRREDVVCAWHDCLPDSYEVTYNFSHWPRWRAVWRVTGPRKDYTMITDYSRL